MKFATSAFAAAALAATSLFVANAQAATATASASFQDLTLTVIDLRPDDGIAAGYEADMSSFRSVAMTHQCDWTWGYCPMGAGKTNYAWLGPVQGHSADASGTSSAATHDNVMTAEATAARVGAEVAAATGTNGRWDANVTAPLLGLKPHTALRLTGLARVTGSIACDASGCGSVQALAELTDLGYSVSSLKAGLGAWETGGAHGTSFDMSLPLELILSNDTDNYTIRILSASVYVDTRISAVPEPASIALCLAGLGLVGAAAARRQRRG